MNHDEEDLESVNGDEMQFNDDEEIFTSVDHFINHACFFGVGELTLGQLQRAAVTFPHHNFKDDLLQHDVLHIYLGKSAPCPDEGDKR